MMTGARRDYLDPVTLPHVMSNVGICTADPGELTPEQARREHELHKHCSPECRVRMRSEQYLRAEDIPGQQPTRPIAIPCLCKEIRRDNDESDMRLLGQRLGYDVDEQLVVLDPDKEWPLTTIVRALQDRPGAAILVPDLDHVDGLDREVQLIADLITVAEERVLPHAPFRDKEGNG
ncbi:hypothetical protein ABIA39_008930 [Nocardia sp. GAS34]|uniref:hypothetical protein n=1 Tax=unclassified Nocardia TaxID=2637762 RepID=UPI003D25E627